MITLFTITLFSCEQKDEEEDMSLCAFESKYKDVDEIQFKINGINYKQNLGSKAYEGTSVPNIAKIYNFTNGANGTRVELFFTRAQLSNEETCDVEFQHRLVIAINKLQQGLNETKTYPVDIGLFPEGASSSYINETNNVELAADSSSITITQYIPDNILNGYFSINYSKDTKANGTFNLDLMRTY